MGRKSKVRVQEEETEDELYQVEVIEKARVDEHSQWEYYVKWAGYPADQNTWEPDENLASCRRLLESFWAQFPDPDVDYDIGQELIPPQEWIDKEKARSFAEQQTLNAERDKKKAARANGKLEKKKAKAQAAKSRSGSVSSDVHLPGPLTNSKRSNKKAEQNVSSTRRDTSMDTDDDQPLANSIKKAKKQRKVMILDDDEDMDSTSDGKPLLSLRNPLKEGKIRAPDSHSEVIKRPGSPSNNSVISLSSSSSDEPLSRTLPKKTKGLSDQVPVSQVKAHHKLPKIRNLPLAVGAGGLATKNRLASTTTTTPTTTSAAAAFPKKNGLANLSFKKKVAKSTETPTEEAPPPSPVLPETRRPAPVRRPTTQMPAPTLSTSAGVHSINTAKPFNVVPNEMQSPDPLAEAEKFLAANMPTELAAPLVEAVDVTPQRRSAPVASGSYKIPKKWKWSGSLLLRTDAEGFETCCSVMISEPTDPHLPSGLKFNYCFTSLESIQLKKLTPLTQLPMILPACRPVQQIAHVTADDANNESLILLANYMYYKGMVSSVDLFVGEDPVGLLLLFPPRIEGLCKQFQVPERMRECRLVAALLPWVLTSADCVKLLEPQTTREPDFPRSAGDLMVVGDLGPGKHRRDITPAFRRASYVLKIPRALHETLSHGRRAYCIWYFSGDGTSERPGLETVFLRNVLDHYGARDAGYKADVRIVFVHAGALATLHKLEALADRRCKRPEIQFYLYGSHDNVPPERWGIRPIYPLGGIVTFTPRAIIEDPLGSLKLLRQLAEHPLWTVYLLPWVVGIVVNEFCGQEEPLSEFDRGSLAILDDILQMLSDGDILLMDNAADPCLSSKDAMRWASLQCHLRNIGSRGVLEMCLASRMEKSEIVADAAGTWRAVVADLFAMQTVPAVMDHHRRFVLVQEKQGALSAGLEAATTTTFLFKDDFFRNG